MKKFLLTAAVLMLVSGRASADLVFDNFNVNEGHFTSNVTTASGSNVAMASTSTADRVTTDAREGLGSQKLTLVHDATANAQRLRHLSGAGTPANNTVFTTTSGPGDGFIGFWLKADTAGWTVQLALDGPLPDLQGGVPRTVIADNTWRLYEWNLDLATDWGAVGGIAGNTTFEQGNQTIDSIVFRGPTTANLTSTFFLDFVALSSSGSVALITPAAVPEAGSVAAMGLVGLISAGAVWIKKRRTERAAV